MRSHDISPAVGRRSASIQSRPCFCLDFSSKNVWSFQGILVGGGCLQPSCGPTAYPCHLPQDLCPFQPEIWLGDPFCSRVSLILFLAEGDRRPGDRVANQSCALWPHLMSFMDIRVGLLWQSGRPVLSGFTFPCVSTAADLRCLWDWLTGTPLGALVSP